MKITMIMLRTLMGLLFILASLVVLLNMAPQPTEFPSAAAKAFNDGIRAASYFMPLLKVTELICGILFVIGRFVPLATVVIAPIIINIAGYHFFVDHTAPGPYIAAFLIVANAFVAYYYRASYRALFAAKPIV
jgi:putative oxidoreductase